jgi:adenine-specific DNA-methyltransferase
MLNNFLEKIYELLNIIDAPIDDVFKIMALKKYKKIFSMDNEMFSDLY